MSICLELEGIIRPTRKLKQIRSVTKMSMMPSKVKRGQKANQMQLAKKRVPSAFCFTEHQLFEKHFPENDCTYHLKKLVIGKGFHS